MLMIMEYGRVASKKMPPTKERKNNMTSDRTAWIKDTEGTPRIRTADG